MAQKRDSEDADATKADAGESAPASPPIGSSPGDVSTFDSVLANAGMLQHARARAHALIAESRALRTQALALGVRFTPKSSAAEGVSVLSDMGKFLRDLGEFLSELEAHCRVSRANRGVNELMNSTLSLFKEIDMLLNSILASEPDGTLSAGPLASQHGPDTPKHLLSNSLDERRATTTPHPSPLTPHPSPLTPHPSRPYGAEEPRQGPAVAPGPHPQVKTKNKE